MLPSSSPHSSRSTSPVSEALEDSRIAQSQAAERLRLQFRGLFGRLSKHATDMGLDTPWTCVQWLQQALTELRDLERQATLDYLQNLDTKAYESADLLNHEEQQDLALYQSALKRYQFAVNAPPEKSGDPDAEREEQTCPTLLGILLEQEEGALEEGGDSFYTLFEALRTKRVAPSARRLAYAPQWMERWSNAFNAVAFPSEEEGEEPPSLQYWDRGEDFPSYFLKAIADRQATTEDSVHFIFFTEVSGFLETPWWSSSIRQVETVLTSELDRTQKELTEWADSAAALSTRANNQDRSLVQRQLFSMKKLLIQYHIMKPLYPLFQGLFDSDNTCFSTQESLRTHLSQKFSALQEFLKIPPFAAEEGDEEENAAIPEGTGEEIADPEGAPPPPKLIKHYMARPLVEAILQMMETLAKRYVLQPPSKDKDEEPQWSFVKIHQEGRLSLENIAVTCDTVEELLNDIQRLMIGLYYPVIAEAADRSLDDKEDSYEEVYKQIVDANLFGPGSSFFKARGYLLILKDLLSKEPDSSNDEDRLKKRQRFHSFCESVSLDTNPEVWLGEFFLDESFPPQSEEGEEDKDMLFLLVNLLNRLCAESIFSKTTSEASRATFVQHLPKWCVFLPRSTDAHQFLSKKGRLLANLYYAVRDPNSQLSQAVAQQKFDDPLLDYSINPFGMDMSILKALQIYFDERQRVPAALLRDLTSQEKITLNKLNDYQTQRFSTKIAEIRALLLEFQEEGKAAEALLEPLQELEKAIEKSDRNIDALELNLDDLEEQVQIFVHKQLEPLEAEIEKSMNAMEGLYQGSASWPSSFLNPLSQGGEISQSEWGRIDSRDKKIVLLAKALARKARTNAYQHPVFFYEHMFADRALPGLTDWILSELGLPWDETSCQGELHALFHNNPSGQKSFKKYYKDYLKECYKPNPAPFDSIALKILDEEIQSFLDRAQAFEWRFEGVLAPGEREQWQQQYIDLLKKREDLLKNAGVADDRQPIFSEKYRLFPAGLYIVSKQEDNSSRKVQLAQSSLLSLYSWRKGVDRLGDVLSRIYKVLAQALLRLKRWAMKSPSVPKELTVGEKAHAHKPTFMSFREAKTKSHRGGASHNNLVFSQGDERSESLAKDPLITGKTGLKG